MFVTLTRQKGDKVDVNISQIIRVGDLESGSEVFVNGPNPIPGTLPSEVVQETREEVRRLIQTSQVSWTSEMSRLLIQARAAGVPR